MNRNGANRKRKNNKQKDKRLTDPRAFEVMCVTCVSVSKFALLLPRTLPTSIISSLTKRKYCCCSTAFFSARSNCTLSLSAVSWGGVFLISWFFFSLFSRKAPTVFAIVVAHWTYRLPNDVQRPICVSVDSPIHGPYPRTNVHDGNQPVIVSRPAWVPGKSFGRHFV